MKPPILHFIDTTGPGGAETIFLELASGMQARGWPARTVVVGPGWVLEQLERRKLPVRLVETSGRFDLRYLRALRGEIREHGIGLVQAHLFSPAAYASLLGLWTGVPVVASFHGTPDTVPGGPGRRLRYRLIERGSTVVCVSEALREDLVSSRLIDAGKIRVIHNGIEHTQFGRADGAAVRRAHGIADDVILVGALGNLRPLKDYPTLLEAAARMAGDARVQFAIVGERTEPLHAELMRQRDALGLGERVSFWGFRQDVAEVIAAFDVLAVSSRSEGFSLAAIQAMAAGKPVVATRSGGPESIITHERDGLLVPPGTPAALAAALERVATDRELRARLGAAGRATVAARFSVQAMLDRYEALYEERTGAGHAARNRGGPRRVAGSAR